MTNRCVLIMTFLGFLAGCGEDGVSSAGDQSLYDACVSGRVDAARELIADGAEVNAARPADGATPLYLASHHGHAEVVQLLLEAEAGVNAADADGRTPLWMASQSGHAEVIQLLLEAEVRDVEVVCPIDFILENGAAVEEIPLGAWQRDIGPATRALFEEKALAWAKNTSRRVAFHNGVMGQFEVKTFAAGTAAMMGTLKKLQAAGVSVYVGGGEGRKALETYATLGDITHAFTAGGTILKSLAGRPLPFLVALAEQAEIP